MYICIHFFLLLQSEYIIHFCFLSVSSAFESCNSSQVSAESVAISLLKKFSEKQLPKASDLQWMVSEKDAPQAVNIHFLFFQTFLSLILLVSLRLIFKRFTLA